MKRMIASMLMLWVGSAVELAWGAPAADRLLPSTTKGYVAFPNIDDFRQRWRQTEMGQLAADPVMKPFVEDLGRQVRERFIRNRFNLALTWDDIAEACGGELTLAAILPDDADDPKAHAAVLILDITGRLEAAQRVLGEAAKQLEARGATRQAQQIGDHEMVIFDLPRRRGEALAEQVCQCLVDDLLIISNHSTVAEDILQRYLTNGADDNLANLVTYRRVMERVQSESGSAEPQVRWFIEPFGYAEVMRAARGGPRKRRKDMLAILKTQGFDAIQAIGGWIHLATDEHEVLHRTFVFAPGQTGDSSRFQLAARMLEFPNVDSWDWPSWIPRDLASATMFHLKTREAFEYSSTLVDAIAGDERFFEDLLSSIKDDPNGPQIDVRSQFVAHLGELVTVISDYTMPVTPQSERLLVAVAVSNEEAVQETLRKALVSDPDARELDVDGHVVWEIIDQQDDSSAPDLELNIDGIDPIGDAVVHNEHDSEERILRNSAITVANGQFLIATHVDLLRRILAKRNEGDRLAVSEDAKLIDLHLQRIGAGSDSLRSFSRTDEAYRPTYELVRQGRMPESESILGRLLNRLLGPDDEDMLREQSIDGSQLPEFQAVRRYLGPAGMFMQSEEDGWYAAGLLLSKQALYVDRTGPAADGNVILSSPSQP